MSDDARRDPNGAGELPAASALVSAEDFPACYEALRDQLLACVRSEGRWAIVGIKRGGAVLARRLADDLRDAGAELSFGELDISLYRDDYHLKSGSPRLLGTEIDFAVDGASILLIDDVLYTGRTVRAAMDQLLDFGRPRRIWLGVLLDRGHRELPIEPNFVGRRVETQPDDRVVVRLKELGFDVDDARLALPGRARGAGGGAG